MLMLYLLRRDLRNKLLLSTAFRITPKKGLEMYSPSIFAVLVGQLLFKRILLLSLTYIYICPKIFN